MTLVVIHIECVCMSVCVGRVMLEHSKAALVIAVSALKRRTGSLVGKQSITFSPSSLSSSAGLAVLANVNKTWPVCVCVWMYFQIFEPLAALDSSQTRETGLRNGNKSNNSRFSSIQKIITTTTTTTLQPESNFMKKPVDFQLCWKCVSVLLWPGLVSVCVTRGTVFKEKVTREQHLVWNYWDVRERKKQKTLKKGFWCGSEQENQLSHVPPLK